MSDSAAASAHNAIVVGGGIAGLTTALCLQRAGLQPIVIERAPAIEEIGAGIQLSPNACRVLDAIGVIDAVRASAFAPERLEMRIGISGRPVFAIDAVNATQKRWGAPYLHVHRADLVAALAAALRERMPGALVTGAEMRSLQQDDAGARVTLADGRTLDAGIVVGADGIHSRVREQLFGASNPQFTGNVAWRATVAVDRLGAHAPPPSACVWVGPGRHAVTYRLRGGALANIVGVVEHDDWHSESWTERGERAQAVADFAGWHPVVTTLIGAADEHYRWALFDRPPLARWHDGRAVLVGDACHPMLPFLAQGAAMAIEDAWVLAAMLARGGPDADAGDSNARDDSAAAKHLGDAFADFTVARAGRVRKVYDGARHNMRVFHHRNRAKQALVYGTMRVGGRLLPGVAASRLDWLYGEDVTARYPLTR